MADEAKEPSTPTGSDRPKSARASKKGKKKKDLANLDLVMSGLKTEKEKLLAKYLQAQIKKTNEKEAELKKVNVSLKQANQKVEKYEKTSKKARDAVYKEQKLRTSAVSDQQRVNHHHKPYHHTHNRILSPYSI